VNGRIICHRGEAVDEFPEGFRPPYMSFLTFWNFIDELSRKPLPPRIDRSLMGSKSGTDQANLAMALTSFGLTDSEANVQPVLRGLVAADVETRKQMLSDLVNTNYAGPMRVSGQNGTQTDLAAAFRDDYPAIASADTRRKAITFFLHAARTAGIEVSAHFPPTRAGSGAPGTAKPKRQAARRKPTGTPGNDGAITSRTNPPSGDTYTVDLASGGVVSVVVSVNLFDLTTDDRAFVIDLVDKLKGYGSPTPPARQESP
jgi:hypothetical protein